MKIRALLLDVMGTLVEEPFYGAVPAFFGVSLEELRALKHPTSWIEFERGLIDEAAYVAQFFTDGRKLDADGLKRAMYDAYAFIEGTEDILVELKERGVPMFALSNYSPWYQLIEQKLALSRYLEWRFVSCLTGHRKPEPAAFAEAARALELPADACLFVDDRAINVEGARAVGMPAVQFKDASSLRAALIEHGVL